MGEPAHPDRDSPTISVVVASSSPVATLTRCLESLAPQAQEAEVLIVSNREAAELAATRQAFPGFRFIHAAGSSDVFALRSIGVAAATGTYVVLTEDHITVGSDWLAKLRQALDGGHLIVGGPIDASPIGSAFDRALFLAEYGLYMPPLTGGRTAALSGVNVAYHRNALASCRDTWHKSFREGEVHDALAALAPALFLAPDAVVTTELRMSWREAIGHLFAGGRHYARYRCRKISLWGRIGRCVGAPVVVLLMLGRLAGHVWPRRRRHRWSAGAIVAPLLLLLCAWSAGEAMGYLRGPSEREAGPERR